eukprot:m.148835 g.148835  ORF g.148835 m.148835 type:complete len:402 (+) comp17328_c0_seq2:1018-2223(+)
MGGGEGICLALLFVTLKFFSLNSVANTNTRRAFVCGPSMRVSAAFLLNPSPSFREVSLADVENAISFALHNELSLPVQFNTQELIVLRKFLGLLAQLPLGKKYVSALRCIQKATHDSPPLKPNGWRAIMSKCNLPHPGNWAQCRGSQPHFRGYTCGLWSVFHSVLSTCPGERQARSALRTVAAFVKHFFGCRVCAEHFADMAATLDNDLATHDQGTAVLWLWRAHNRVNLRLKSPDNPSQDPQHPKQLFPTMQQCPSCRPSGEESEFDEAAVLDFLQGFYGMGIADDLRGKVPQNGKSHVGSRSKPSHVRHHQGGRKGKGVRLDDGRSSSSSNHGGGGGEHGSHSGPAGDGGGGLVGGTTGIHMLSLCVLLNIVSVFACWWAINMRRRAGLAVLPTSTKSV